MAIFVSSVQLLRHLEELLIQSIPILLYNIKVNQPYHIQNTDVANIGLKCTALCTFR